MKKQNSQTQLGYFSIIATYCSFFNVLMVGHIRDQLGKIFVPWNFYHFFEQKGIPAFFSIFDSFFIRRLYLRISDCWNRPIHGVPGRMIQVLERVSEDYNVTMRFTGEKLDVLNIGSYNYLGFAVNEGPILEKVLEAAERYPINYAYPPIDCNENQPVKDLERTTAEFLGLEDCVVFSMGFGTNIAVIPALMQDSLILSDQYNHMSLIKGMKLSRSKVIVYQHNDLRDLESKLKYHISQGEPESHRQWKRVFVVVEGIFSMEGTIVNLKKLVELKKIYHFYIYVDEAHSVGALGNNGRGVCEYFGVNNADVDIHMGTYSKGFGGFGGYIAGKKELINYLRANNMFHLYGEQISPVVATQVLSSIKMIMEDNSRVERLYENTRKIRDALVKKKFYVLGDDDSPVVPMLIPAPGKIGDFSRLCLEQGIAIVVVGYPATPVLLNRVRICMSSVHTDEDINKVIHTMDQIGRVMGMKKL